MILYKNDIEKLQKIRDFIDSNLDQDLSIGRLCKLFSMSRAKLQRHFSFHFKLTVYHYVLDRRMNTAKSLLDNRSSSVADIASIIGYKDRCSFTRAFSKFFSDKPIDHLKSGE